MNLAVKKDKDATLAPKLKIGVVGAFASGKATFLNALFKAPCFEMKSHTHNGVVVVVKASHTSKMNWLYRNNDSEEWKIAQTELRQSLKHKQLAVEVPFFPFSQGVFYDFPQINDLDSWEEHHLSLAQQMDYVIYLLDAEYAMSAKNSATIHLLSKKCKNLVVILNKSEIVDNIEEINTSVRDMCLPSKTTLVFSVSAQLELQRCLHAAERVKTFAFTESRKNVMMLCDLDFANFRVWLYETMNKKLLTNKENASC